MKTQILIAVILFIILTGFSEFDFDGIPRTGKYPGDKPDIGAFEYDPNIGAFVYDPTSGDNDSGNNGSSSNSGCFVKTVNRIIDKRDIAPTYPIISQFVGQGGCCKYKNPSLISNIPTFPHS